MKKLVPILVLVAMVLGLTGWAIYKYEHRYIAPKGETIAQALAAQATAQKTLAIHDAVYNQNLTSLTTQKATLCAQIKTAKLVQPLCV